MVIRQHEFSYICIPQRLDPRICHKCSQSHPLDAASFSSHCPSADHIVQSFIHAWPLPFNQVASIWWAQCSHPGGKKDFVKFLVPSTLYEAMTTPTTGETKPQRVLALKNALPQRQRQLKDALSKALTMLAEDPPPLPRPPHKVSTSGANHTAPTARHTPHRRTAITTIPCLQTTCHTQSKPPPPKKTTHPQKQNAHASQTTTHETQPGH